MTNYVEIYEYPLQPTIRTYLRLEQVFKHADHCAVSSSTHLRQGLVYLDDLLSLAERSDFKKNLHENLRHIHGNLERLHDTPSVNRTILSHALDKISHAEALLLDFERTLFTYRKNELLNLARKKTDFVHNMLSDECPALYHWLTRGKESYEQFQGWMDGLSPFRECIALFLNLIRQSASSSSETSYHGRFNKALPHEAKQLLRISIAKDLDVMPEISVTAEYLNLRFLKFTDTPSAYPQPSKDPITFELTYCAL